MEEQFTKLELDIQAGAILPEPPGPLLYGDIPVDESRWVLKMARGLKRKDPLRVMVEEIANGDRKTIDSLEPVTAAFNITGVSGWKDKLLAAWLLGRAALTPMQRRVAGEALTHALSNRSTSFPSWSCLFGCFTGPFFFIIAPVILALSQLFAKRSNMVRAAAARSLGMIRDPGCLGPLVSVFHEADSSGSGEVRKAARYAFPEVVSTLTADYYGFLPFQTVPDLCRALHMYDRTISEAALEALGKVGDGRAVDPVKQIAENARHHLCGRANAVLPILLERKSREQASQVLLRPSSGPGAYAKTLLRPAGSGEDANEKLLLRPSLSEEEG